MPKPFMDLEWKLFQFATWLDLQGLLRHPNPGEPPRSHTTLVKDFLKEDY